ncbi:hypothetical protein XENOCAPTIV_019536 [Xenoophorus captivus]|uniref:Uncharacterized protein n=1 Tax=Xenoophorus captivus TaxID=1517983 RepID=A0ABV0SGI1_9TELE
MERPDHTSAKSLGTRGRVRLLLQRILGSRSDYDLLFKYPGFINKKGVIRQEWLDFLLRSPEAALIEADFTSRPGKEATGTASHAFLHACPSSESYPAEEAERTVVVQFVWVS